jgi:dihydroorotate dehydrogenase (fumarate)
MANLATKYMGLDLKNPIIVGSSGLMDSLNQIRQAADNGAGAVVLKSIFEEQIHYETNKFIERDSDMMAPFRRGYDELMTSREFDYAEAKEYVTNYAREHTLSNYLKFVNDVKQAINIPVIASINCVTPYDWHYFARRIEAAGADAIELNIYVLPSNPTFTSEENEKTYFSIVEEVLKQANIPVSVKVSYYFSSLSKTLVRLSNSGIKGIVMFNRPFHPDIDINEMKVTSKFIFSDPAEYSHTLRWMAILSGRANCDLVAATGIHDHNALIKQLLVGATAVQMVSAFYKHGFEHIRKVVRGLESWMDSRGYNRLEDFRGLMSQKNIDNPAAFERVQFMKLYSQIV